MGVLVFLFLVVLVFALIPAAIAARKGRSSLGFFLLSFVLTPLISLIVVLIIDPGRDHVSKPARKAAEDERKAAQIAAEDAAYRAKAEAKYSALLTPPTTPGDRQ